MNTFMSAHESRWSHNDITFYTALPGIFPRLHFTAQLFHSSKKCVSSFKLF